MAGDPGQVIHQLFVKSRRRWSKLSHHPFPFVFRAHDAATNGPQLLPTNTQDHGEAETLLYNKIAIIW